MGVSNSDLHKYLSPDFYTVGIIWTRRMDLEFQCQKIKGDSGFGQGKKKEQAPAHSVKPGISCSDCLVNTATCQCIKCDCILCRPCFDRIHRLSNIFKKHQPIPYSPTKDERLPATTKTRSRRCPAHEQCQIEYFCTDDNQTICSRCVIMGDHKGHAVQTMEDKNKECLSEMEPALVLAQETVWRLEKSEKALRKAMPKAKIDTSRVEEEVRNHFQELHSLLQSREEQLLDEIHEAANSVAKPFQEMKNYLQEEKINFEQALVDAARVMQGNIHRLIDADLVLERLKKANDVACVLTLKADCENAPIKFVPDPSFRDVLDSAGSISVASPSQLFQLSVPSPDAEKPPEDELRHYTASDLETLSTTDTESIADSASVIVEDDKDDTDSVHEPVVVKVFQVAPPPLKTARQYKIGHMEHVSLTHIKTPAQFYVQLNSRRGEMMTLEHQIQKYCRSMAGKKATPELVEPGSLVLAQYSGNKEWYRARIICLEKPDSDVVESISYQVFFIDYGNSQIVKLDSLCKIKKKYATPAPFAYECSLVDILPADQEKGWSSESVKSMLEMTGGGPMLMQVVKMNGGVLEVDLSKPETEISSRFDSRPVSVRDCLVFLEMAIFNTRTFTTSANAPAVMRDYISMPRQEVGQVVDIGINCVHHPLLFYAQIYNDETHRYLHDMLSCMQQVYNKETQHLYTIFCPRKDMLCMARYHKDNNWYRAKVTGLPGGRKVEVQFVDYGNTEIADHSDVCVILDDYIKYPMQAWECALVDVEPVTNGQWSDQAKAWFKSLMELQLCQFRVMSHNNKPNSMVGVLYVITEGRLCCVNYELVQMGFANSTGPWSKEESFLGITMRPETHQNMYGASASPETSMHFSIPDLPSSPTLARSSLAQQSPTSCPLQAPTSPEKRQPKNTLKKQANQRRSPQKATAGQNVKLESRNGDTASCGSKKKGDSVRVVDDEVVKEATCSPGGGSVAVLLSGYQSPAHFFIQLEDKQEQLAKLMDNLDNYNRLSAGDQIWKVGEFCVAKYTQDDRWYRGRIEKQLDDLFEVSMLDYGYVDTVSASRLQPLKRSFGKVDCFAERCHLANLMPAGSVDPTKWSNTAKEFVLQQTRGKRLFVKMEGERVDKLGLPVDILIEETIPETAFEPQTHEYVSLISLLLDRGLALPAKRTKEDKMEPASSPHTFQTKLLPAGDQDVSLSPDKFRTDSKSGDASEEEQDKEAVVIIQPTFTVAPHPPPSSNCMIVFPVFVDYDGIIYAHDVGEEQLVDNLMTSLANYVHKEAPDGVLEVSRGQICISHFDNDDAWYRALVLEVTDYDIKVKYIDYGNSERMDKTRAARNLKLITPELCLQPQVAFMLKLHNVTPATVDGTWPHSFLDYMHHQIVCSPVAVEFKGDLDQNPLEVEVVLEDGSSIANTLVQCGVLTRENDMEEFYQRSSDISNILQHSNPYFPLKLGEKGAVFTGLITHIELPNLVYIQRSPSPVDGSISPDMQDFVRMMDDLNNLPPQTPTFEELPAAGEVCSSRYALDNRWYRGLVAKCNRVSNTALIYYVDYGNSEIVTLDRLRVLPQRFQDMPAQALRAYLNIDLPQGCKRWTVGTYKAMVDAISLRSHFVLVKHQDPLTVELYSSDQVLSYQQLVNKGLVTVPPSLFAVSPCDTDNVIVEDSDSEQEQGE